MNLKTALLSPLALATLSVLAPAAFAQPNQSFITHQLKPNVYWIEGGGGNSTIIIGTHGVIVVDAKTTKAGGQDLLANIAKITPKPVTTVILTHSDGDHVNGLAAFPTGLKIIANQNNKKEQQAAIAAGGTGAPPADHLPTVVTTKTKETMIIDGVKLELYHWAPAHTSGDLVVYLPAEKIVATGDIIATNSPYPRLHDEKNGSAAGWITTAKGIVALDADTFVPGHGPIQTKADIQKRLADATGRRDEVRKLAAQGKSLAEVKAAVGDNEKLTYKSWTEQCYMEATKK